MALSHFRNLKRNKRNVKRTSEDIELLRTKSSSIEHSRSSATQLPQLEANETSASTKKPKLRIRLEHFYQNLYVDPFEKIYYAWLVVNTIFYSYNFIFIIARASFWLLQEIDYSFIWIIMDYSADCIYLLDILFRFFTGYMENGEICGEKRKIAKKYVTSLQFKIDLVSLLPLDAIYFLIPNKELAYQLIPALRLNRLLKFSRFIEFRNMTETKTKYPTVFRMSNLLINILFAMHWNACIYFLISRLLGFGSDIWVYPALTDPEQLKNLTEIQLNNMLQTHKLDMQYIYCFWWSVLLMTTIAEVPPPVYYYEEIFMSLEYMIGVVIIAITIGSAAQMVENANRQSLDLQMKGDYAKTFLKQHKIVGELEMRIKNYLDYLWISSDANQDVLYSLPANLRKEIAMNVHMETLKRVKIFEDCEPGLLEELVTKLKPQVYSPGDYVCRKGDVGHEMYFIKMGKLQVVSPDGKQVYATLGAGAAFGEISILDIPGNKNGNKRTANIRSLGFSDVFSLSKNDLWDALSEYPVAKKTLLEKGKALLKKDNLLDEELAERIERKHKPLKEQIEYFQQNNNLTKLTHKLEETYKSFLDFLDENKEFLQQMEQNLELIKTN